MNRSEIEFLNALRKVGLSASLCESVNEIRRAVFEESEAAKRKNTTIWKRDDSSSWGDPYNKTKRVMKDSDAMDYEFNAEKEEDYTPEKKYELTGETMEWNGRTLHRIVALKHIEVESGSSDDTRVVEEGDLGGWVEGERNLGHEGNCWVADEAKVYDNAKVYGDAVVEDNAEVSGDAKVYENAKVYGNADISEWARVHGDADVSGKAVLCWKTEVSNGALVYDRDCEE